MTNKERERRLREKSMRKPKNDTTLVVQDSFIGLMHSFKRMQKKDNSNG